MTALFKSLFALPGHFAAPEWLWFLPALPLLALLRWRAQHLSRRGLPGLISPKLVTHLIRGASEPLRWMRFLLFLGALGFLVLALARPQFGTEQAEARSRSRDLFIALDTSRSMLAVDLEPNRLARARLAIHEIVDSMPEDRIGLIAFAGNGFLLAPLTLDHPAVVEALDQMEPGLVPRGGTNLSAPLSVALDQLRRSGADGAALLIFTDGEDHEGKGDVALLAKQAKEAELVVFAVGVGTESGAIIPATDDDGKAIPGQFVEDDAGSVVRSRLQPAALQEISAATGGVYVNLGERGSLTTVVSRVLNAVEATTKEAEARPKPIERFVWPLGVALMLLVAAWMLPTHWRRPLRAPSAVLAGLVLLFGLPSRAGAEATDSRGFEALRLSDYDGAIEAYEKEIPLEKDPDKATWMQLGLGTAAFRKGDYEKAKQAFSEALQSPRKDLAAQAHYNLGNTLFEMGKAEVSAPAQNPDEPAVETGNVEAVKNRWKEALDQYRSALSLEPGDRKAKHNLDVVSQYMQVLRKKEEEKKEQEKKEDKKDEDKKDEDQKDDQNKDQNQNPQNQGQQPPPDGQQPPPDGQQPPPPKDGQQPPQDGQQPPPPKDGQQQPGQPPPPGDQKSPQDPKEGQQPPPPPKGQPKPDEGNPEQDQGKPPEGEISAQPGQSPPPQPGKPQGEPRNEETGLTPSEARKQLKDNSDEDLKAMPLQTKGARAERYKDW